MGDALNKNLIQFIGSGLMDYAYAGSEAYHADLTKAVNPIGFSNVIKEYMKTAEFDFSKYPEVNSTTLKNKIAKVYNLNPDKLLVGAGFSSLIHVALLSLINPGDTVLIPGTTFPQFEFITILINGKSEFIPHLENFDINYDAFTDMVTPKVKVVVLSNPNNPTGIQIHKDKLTKIISDNPKTMFFLDEVNVDLGGEGMMDLTDDYDNTFVFRSFSKGFGLAGLRVGFVVGSSGIIQAMKRRQTPFMVGVVAQKIAEVALDDMEHLEKSKKYVLKERKYLEEELSKLGYSYIPSDSNYLMVCTKDKGFNSTAFINKINRLGANAVDGCNFRGLQNRFIRLSPKKHNENERFIEVVKKVTPR